jgi:hypothetical protein
MSKRSKRASFYKLKREGRKSRFNLNQIFKRISNAHNIMVEEVRSTLKQPRSVGFFTDCRMMTSSQINAEGRLLLHVQKLRPATRCLTDIRFEYTSLGPEGLTTVGTGKLDDLNQNTSA